MKPFDLERALAGDKVITRNGKEASYITHFPTSIYNSSKVVAVIDGIVSAFHENGFMYEERESETDLFMAPKMVTVYQAIHSDRIIENSHEYDYVTITGLYKNLEALERVLTDNDRRRPGFRIVSFEIEE